MPFSQMLRQNFRPDNKEKVFKGVLSRIISISLESQNKYLCHRKPTNNGLFLLTIVILVR